MSCNTNPLFFRLHFTLENGVLRVLLESCHDVWAGDVAVGAPTEAFACCHVTLRDCTGEVDNESIAGCDGLVELWGKFFD